MNADGYERWFREGLVLSCGFGIRECDCKLPPGAVIRDGKGNVVDKLSLTRTPAGRTPFPMPKNVVFPVYFTAQPGGAWVEVNGARVEILGT